MTVSDTHGKITESLANRLLAELGSHIHSIVLFGSVARGEAHEESDIDVLLITEAPFETRKRIHEISYDIDLENEVFTQTVFFTTQAFEREVNMRSYFSTDVLSQGIVLYDDGTFRRIRRNAVEAVTGVP